ncbi:hypothetical protein TKK_0008495 [Trichogramma kaykai]
MSLQQRIEASTTVTLNECIFTWTIKNYSLMKSKVGESIESPQFSVGSDDKKYFKLQLYPLGRKNEESMGYISLFIVPCTITLRNILNKHIYRITLSAVNNKKVVKKLTSLHVLSSFSDWGNEQFFKLEDIDKLISSENTVTVQCELDIFNELDSSLDSDIINDENEMIDNMKFHFSFLNKELSDVKLITSDEKELPAHKIILATASPVFRAMFAHDMLENKENSVKITDITENILTEMLRYIYTGEIDAIETDMIIELLAVADKYQIDNLKTKCGKILYSYLSIENAIKILIAAHKHQVKNLEDKVIEFATAHKRSLIDSEQLKLLADPTLLVNLMQSIIKSSEN